jgi:hypothetical protein
MRWRTSLMATLQRVQLPPGNWFAPSGGRDFSTPAPVLDSYRGSGIRETDRLSGLADRGKKWFFCSVLARVGGSLLAA